MERASDLLEKYFRGETTLAEESELKQYFRTSAVLPEHELYRAMFVTFDEELKEKANKPDLKILPEQKKVKRMWIQTFIYTGVAASLLIALWVKYPKQPENFAVVSGAKIQDTEFAEKYADKKGVEGSEGHFKGKSPFDLYVYSTSLCCLMLEVYYRYLPTFKVAGAADFEGVVAKKDSKDELKIE